MPNYTVENTFKTRADREGSGQKGYRGPVLGGFAGWLVVITSELQLERLLERERAADLI
jgi:hypothetical protein